MPYIAAITEVYNLRKTSNFSMLDALNNPRTKKELKNSFTIVKMILTYISRYNSTHKPDSSNNQKLLTSSSHGKDFLYRIVHKEVAPTRLYEAYLAGVKEDNRSVGIVKERWMENYLILYG